MRPLQRTRDEALADFLDQGFLRRDVPIFALKIVRWLAGPDLQNLIYRFEKHLVEIGIEIAEELSIRQQSAGTDPENQASVEHVVEHRQAGRDGGRMGV